MTSNGAEAHYAFWDSPERSFTITYSLEQFHEIDFQVNEGYRRIPHGGIEVGGLLFGRNEPAGIRVDAFRPIECEHATGPSFNLSERDLDELQKQISGSGSDPELAGLELVGWFIAHTRTPLRLTDRELAVFERFFPGRHQITALIKPERFQPTKFAFLARRADGSLERDGSARAVILPLPGRGIRGADGPLASIPAPAEKASPSTPIPAEPRTGQASQQDAPAIPKPSVSERANPSIPPFVEAPGLQQAAEPLAPPSRHGITRLRPNGPPAENPFLPSLPAEPSETEPVTSLATIPKEKKLPPISEIQRRRSGYGRRARELQPGEEESQTYYARLALILFLAAVLGCGAGYWAYRQLPTPVVPLAVHSEGSGLVVTWPTGQTREAAYAAIRVNDGAQQPLSVDEKSAGAAHITSSSSSNVKVELIVQHWMRDSRGIVRYVSAIPAASPPAE
jgi:hypothetical protein